MRNTVTTIAGVSLVLVSVFVLYGTATADIGYIVNESSPFFPLVTWVAGFWNQDAALFVIMYAVVLLVSLGTGLILLARSNRVNPWLGIGVALAIGSLLANISGTWTLYPSCGTIGCTDPAFVSPIEQFITAYPDLTRDVMLVGIVAAAAGSLAAWLARNRLPRGAVWVPSLIPVVAAVAFLLVSLWIFPYPRPPRG